MLFRSIVGDFDHDFPSAAANGSRSLRKSWSKSPTIISLGNAFVTAQKSLGGETTKRQSNVRSTKLHTAKAAQLHCSNARHPSEVDGSRCESSARMLRAGLRILRSTFSG